MITTLRFLRHTDLVADFPTSPLSWSAAKRARHSSRRSPTSSPTFARQQPTRRSCSMTYFEGFIVPVPEANRDAYQKHATEFAPLVQEVGVAGMVEAGRATFPKARSPISARRSTRRRDEKVVFSWFEYPSPPGARRRQREDHERSAHGGDGQGHAVRRQAHDHGRVRRDRRRRRGWRRLCRRLRRARCPKRKRDDIASWPPRRRRFSAKYGATRVVEAFADDVTHGKVTDF